MPVLKTQSVSEVQEAVTHFSVYSDHIQQLLLNLAQSSPSSLPDDLVSAILNGQATSALQQLVPLHVRRKAGLFFTSTPLANKIAKRLAPKLRTGARLLDPACGAGNLLLACAKYLPVGANLAETLRLWSNSIMGYDLYPEFIRATQFRLAFFAASHHFDEGEAIRHIDPAFIFDKLIVEDFFSHVIPDDVDCIVVNPPFGYIDASADCLWATGKVQYAGQFLEKLFHITHKDQHIIAILPDVLRSGTRYRKWRSLVAGMCSSLEIEMAGRFDGNTDVDVFILNAVVGNTSEFMIKWPDFQQRNVDTKHIVGDFFQVHVGSVVPHRDPIEGPLYPYIHARTAPAWQTIRQIREDRQYAGRVFTPPFVVVHRTSSPSDKSRCIATLIDIEQHVAVENHLLVLLPIDNSIDSCRLLLDVFRSEQSTDWLNQRIRCRHLTVSSLRELPWLGKIPSER
ncbi:MAG TPA: SAM-dependent DNA methyltransferase [Thermoplasmata archaeon]|nr:SAM-dependent DNA methyltransferase [Thermoplasmata archaeon]